MDIPSTAPDLALAPHVRACESDGQVVLLDLRHNRYLGISAHAARDLAARVRGWPLGLTPSSSADLERLLPLVQRLQSQGLLASASSAESRRAPDVTLGVTLGMTPGATPGATLDEPLASLDLSDLDAAGGVTPRRVVTFIKSAALAAVWLRCQSLEAIAARVSQRLQRLGEPCPHAVKRCAAAFETLRPLAFTARERCLHDSLALVLFAASEGLRAHWVVGVKTGPFGAHSWAQSGHVVLNDQHEHVRRFQPILVI